MKTPAKCDCGALRGTAELFMPDKRPVAPVLAWELTGRFFVKKSGDRSVICAKCGKPALGSDWK